MMNYFELFELPVSFVPDKEAVRKNFFALSKKYHPDYSAQGSEEEQRVALETSAQINRAFKTLNNKDATIKYVLMLKGLLAEEEKYSLPPEFLMEMMEINENVAELSLESDPAERTAIHQQLLNLEKEMYEPVAHIIDNYKEGDTSEEELLQVKEYYFKKKYLSRLYGQLNGKL
jgi:molecular chaperone HscB